MKTSFCLLVLAGLLTVAGCSTPNSVAKMEGQGAKRSFNVGYDEVWTSVNAVVVMDNLQIVDEDKTTGFISARLGMGQTTFGDNIAIWIRPISANRTEVEVISRRVGPPVPFAPNRQQAIIRSFAAVLPT